MKNSSILDLKHGFQIIRPNALILQMRILRNRKRQLCTKLDTEPNTEQNWHRTRFSESSLRFLLMRPSCPLSAYYRSGPGSPCLGGRASRSFPRPQEPSALSDSWESRTTVIWSSSVPIFSDCYQIHCKR